MFCSQCGNGLTGDARFCQGCGNAVQPTEAKMAAASNQAQYRAAEPEVIPERIRKNLVKHEKHVPLTCLECGYVGLMGHARTDKKYRMPMVVLAVLYFALAGAVTFIPQLGMLGYFIQVQFGNWFWIVPAVLLIFFMTKETTILECPNCQKEIAQR